MLVGEREILDNQETQEEIQNNVRENGLDVSKASEDSGVVTQDKLINFDAPVNKLDHMTLDDLNDDDFDPRAVDNTSDSSESDEFNPRGSGGFTAAFSVTPAAKAGVPAAAPHTAPAKILPPPSVPARDPAKIGGPKPAPVLSNPFTAQPPPSNDPFGMSSFAAGSDQVAKVRTRSNLANLLPFFHGVLLQDPFSAGVFGQANFSLDQLDPLASKK